VREVKAHSAILLSKIERVGKLKQLVAQTPYQSDDMSALCAFVHLSPTPEKCYSAAASF
jgi:hypothetical protein